MKKINKTRYAILGMLYDKPRSGYEIIQRMSESTAHFWQESDASIYPMLKKLEAEDKLQVHHERTGKRKRAMFEITASGKKEFAAWMALPAQPENVRNELLLKLFFGATGSKESLIKLLEAKLKHSKKIKQTFASIEKNLATVDDKNPHKPFWQMTLKNGILQNKASLAWLKESLETLKT